MTKQSIARELRLHLLTSPIRPISQHLPPIRARYTKNKRKSTQKHTKNRNQILLASNASGALLLMPGRARAHPVGSRYHDRRSLTAREREYAVHSALDDARAGDTGNAKTRLTTEARSKRVLFFVNAKGRERDMRAILGTRALRVVVGDVAGLVAGSAGAEGRLPGARA